MDLSVSSREDGPLTVVTVSGEVDAYTAAQLREHLVTVFAADRYRLVADLTDVQFMDSTGLGVLVGTLKRVREHDGTLQVVCTRPAVVKLFRITGLDGIIPLHADLADACAAAAPAAPA